MARTPKTQPDTAPINKPSKTLPTDNLTDKQRAFVNFYMTNGFNATQAARSAGYSEETARSIGYENLTKPHIKSEIQRIMRDFVMPAEEVLSRLTEHARGDLGDVVYDDGTVDWKEARAQGKTGLIKKLKRRTRRELKKDGTDIETIDEEIELHSPQFALQLLGKHHSLFVDRVEHSGTVSLSWADMVKQASEGNDDRD